MLTANIYLWLILILIKVEIISVVSGDVVSDRNKFPIGKVIFAVHSPNNSYHNTRFSLFRRHLHDQNDFGVDFNIYSIHEKWPFTGSWTLFPIFDKIIDEFPNFTWLFVCEEETRLNLINLIKVLENFDHAKINYLGRAMWDEQPVIIHHFHLENRRFDYPNMAAGVAFSKSLVHDLARRLKTYPPKQEFTIDLSHEISMYIWNEGQGVALTNVQQFCASHYSDECATYYPSPSTLSSKIKEIQDNLVYVAVKTCQAFHNDRLQFVRRTWGRETSNLAYYSDVTDMSIPTISLGVPNTIRGHCAKTFSILKHFLNASRSPWLAVVDDDTIVSLRRLLEMMTRYNSSDAMVMGERYGYQLPRGLGYDYVTGGAGMIFSRPAATEVVSNCKCPNPSEPDDMILGICLKHLNIPIIHSPHLHQARPMDYSADFLANVQPISFHKHWDLDPYHVYNHWFTSRPRKNLNDEL